MQGTGLSNNWGTGANWTNGTPNSTTNACIVNGTLLNPTGVQVSGSQNVLNLQVNANNSLTVNDSSVLYVSGSSVVNSGNIGISGQGGGTYLYLAQNTAPTSLTGGGTLTLSTSAGNPANTLIYGTSGAILDNASNTIQGFGQIGANYGIGVANESLITANVSAQTLSLNGSGGTVNTGSLNASNGGTLQLYYGTNNAGGIISTDTNPNSTVYLMNGASVQGGTLSGNIQTGPGTSYLDGTTHGQINNTQTVTINDSTQAEVQGTINNTGSILISGAGGGTSVYLSNNTTLNGGGTVTLSNSTPQNSYIYGSGASVLDNHNNAIQGYGEIGDNYGISVTNESGGAINANVNGQTLVLNAGGGTSNAGLLEATNGGVLELAYTINNNPNNTLTGATIATDGNVNSKVLLLNGATIQGGTLAGNIQTNTGTSYLNGTTQGQINNTQTLTINDATQVEVQGTINNTGSILLSGAGSGTSLYLANNTTLTGGGTVTLSNSIPQNSYIYGAGASVLDNHNNTIQGSGEIGDTYGISLTNESAGIINANAAGKILYVDAAGGTSNAGLIEATGGGVLGLEYTINNNPNNTLTGGTISTDSNPNSLVQLLNGVTIQGGTLNGNVQTTSGGATLDGASAPGQINNAGTITVNDSTGLYLQGTIHNTGNIALTGTGGGTYVYLNQNTTLTGGGTLTLSNTTPNNTYIYGAGTSILENAGNTIQGFGEIGDTYSISVLNDAGGTILANVTGQTLLLNGNGTVTNNGTFQANAGATLKVTESLSASTFSGTTLHTGTYNVYSGGTIQMNSLGTTGGEIHSNQGTILLDGVNSNILDANGNDALSALSNNAGSFTIRDGRNFTSVSPFTNEGTLTIGAGSTFFTGNGGGGVYTQTAGTTTVDGILDPFSGSIFGGLIDGTGSIDGALNVDLGGVITPGDAGSIGTLTDDGDFLLGSLGTLDIAIGSAGNDFLDITGQADLDGTLDLTALNGFTLTGGDTFYILEDGTRDGTFTTVDTSGLDLGPGLTAEVLYDQGAGDNEVELVINGSTSATPEPGTWFMLAPGLGAIVLLRKKAARA